MTTRRRRGAIPLLTVLSLLPAGLVLGACSGDGDETVTEGSGTSTTAAPTTVAASTTTEGDSSIIVESIPATADLPSVSTAGTADLPPATADLPLLIEVTVGVDSAPDRIEQVPVGTPVTLQLVNPTATDEYHVHGIDLGDGQSFAKGQVASFTFTLDTPGTYEVESHATDKVLVVIEAV